MNLQDKLSVNRYDIDKDIHISINSEICDKCTNRFCLSFCPAGCYTEGTTGQIIFAFEGCLECGSCRIVCGEAIDWRLPRGGFGICYQYG